MTKQKIYIGKYINNINMFPSDLKWSLDDFFLIKKGTKFSISNHLIRCCSKYVKLSKQDFDDAHLIKKKGDDGNQI